MAKPTKQELKDLFANIIFPNDEGDGIEHVDLSFPEFMKLINSMINRIPDVED